MYFRPFIGATHVPPFVSRSARGSTLIMNCDCQHLLPTCQDIYYTFFSYQSYTSHLRNNTSSCNSDTTVRVRLANQSAVLVTSGGSESTLRSGAVTLWHITWAAALAVALGTAKISGQALHTSVIPKRCGDSWTPRLMSKRLENT